MANHPHRTIIIAVVTLILELNLFISLKPYLYYFFAVYCIVFIFSLAAILLRPL